jgi:hypothetical protein
MLTQSLPACGTGHVYCPSQRQAGFPFTSFSAKLPLSHSASGLRLPCTSCNLRAPPEHGVVNTTLRRPSLTLTQIPPSPGG